MALLQGQWRRATAEDRRQLRRTSARPLSANTVAVEFGPPRVALLGGLLPPLQVKCFRDSWAGSGGSVPQACIGRTRRCRRTTLTSLD
eukprot:scaffold20934_cov116-Isochrysis_galbana.AAC.1